MTPYDLPQFAALWREQIAPDELRRLQDMAGKIERRARRKQLVDLAMAVAAVGLFLLFMWLHPVSPAFKLGFALLAAVIVWRGWGRREITKASRAAAIHDPSAFFESAMKNARAEIRHSTTDLWLTVAVIILAPLLVFRARGWNDIDSVLRYTIELNFTKTIAATAVFILAFAFYVRENIRLRERLRRLEGMSREWAEQAAGGPEDGPDPAPAGK